MTHITNMQTGAAKLVAGKAPALRWSFSITAEVDPGIDLMGRDTERLEFIPITGGSAIGEITADVLASGGDWCLNRSDDAYNVEARYGLQTDTGAYIDVVNIGVLRHVADDTGDPEQMGYFVTTPVFRTADPALQWLTRSVFIGQAQVLSHATVIDVYEVMVDTPTAGVAQ